MIFGPLSFEMKKSFLKEENLLNGGRQICQRFELFLPSLYDHENWVFLAGANELSWLCFSMALRASSIGKKVSFYFCGEEGSPYWESFSSLARKMKLPCFLWDDSLPFSSLEGLWIESLFDGLSGNRETFFTEFFRNHKTNLLSIELPFDGNQSSGDPGQLIQRKCLFSFGKPYLYLSDSKWINVLGQVLPFSFSWLSDQEGSSYSYVIPELCLATLPKRKRNDHKGRFGHVLLVGGNSGFEGALSLSILGALKMGAGLVSYHPLSDQLAFPFSPEAMRKDYGPYVNEALQGEEGRLRKVLTPFDSICLGPGLGRDAKAWNILKMVVKGRCQPLVLDADALNLIAQEGSQFLGSSREGRVFTPHPGEAARLLKLSTSEVEADRFKVVLELAQRYQGVVVLKGAHSLVSDGEHIWVHTTGSPVMAAGGMGDVLTGMIGALLAQGLSLVEASNLAVLLHGLSAMDWLRKGRYFGLLASEVAANVPEVYSFYKNSFKKGGMG